MRGLTVFLKSLLLNSVAMIIILIPSSTRAGFNYFILDEKLAELYKLIHEKKNYNGALAKAKEINSMKGLGPSWKEQTSNVIELISNYSDCKRKPLELYFNADNDYASQMLPKGLSQEKLEEYWRKHFERRELSLSELVHDYPNCKLTGFALFELANHYLSQTNNVLSPREDWVAEELAIDAYERLIKKYPMATLPISNHQRDYKKGLLIAPLARMKIAMYYLYSRRPDTEKAIASLRTILKKYPDAKNGEDSNLGVLAYLELIRVYRGNVYSYSPKKDRFKDIGKAKRLCKLLLTKYKNQEFDTGGWFGELHPQALMYLAELEEDHLKAIGIYQEVISRFPRSWSGKSHSCGVSLYLSSAMDNMLALAKDDRHKQKLLYETANSNLSKLARGMALLQLGKFHEGNKNLGKALKAYKLAAKRYKNVTIGLHEGTVGDLAKIEAERLEVQIELDR